MELDLEPPRFGGAFLAVITVVFLGMAAACFGVAFTQETASAAFANDASILRVTDVTASIPHGKIRVGVMTERLRRSENTSNDRASTWVTAER